VYFSGYSTRNATASDIEDFHEKLMMEDGKGAGLFSQNKTHLRRDD
jgi:hypothetical protein